ncbi:uncharacterized protein B0I36DRAFT_122643 [Microdochium trichocladiopsis]|uniref:BZIP domain-containing protein n=1 Tax=Microdochium trichocladiopsis TaxID=1682393 RepID=A0A9P8YA03_9PEZI|nr:uncharacterized protein B0I36DRAFT_122643 [Microdochium trichocladiopsis]KAH7031410.1 hypothetical protein B0I36DRAFT_122643 [Microdochium trichocladiopsis]
MSTRQAGVPQSSAANNNKVMAVAHGTTISPESQTRARTRQRLHKPPTPLDVPDINDDAAERKRVLNVLAQRRYRERKRQSKPKNTTAREPIQSSPPSHPGNDTVLPETQPAQRNSQDTSVEAASPAVGIEGATQETLQSCSAPDSHISSPSKGWPLDFLQISNAQPTLDPTLLQLGGSLSETPESLTTLDTSQLSSEDEAALAACALTDPNCFIGLPELGPFADQSDLASSLSWGSSSSSTDTSHQELEQDFPDSYLLPVTELILLRACTRIGERIQCCDRMWRIDANSSFADGTMTPLAISMLPLSWQPTKSQATVPHHPILDLMPWPSVRDRLLLLMALPDSMKPAAVAEGPMAVIQLAYDMEDSSEGLRVWGGDVYDPMAWEVGQVVFEKWWFVFDRQVVERSNYWRRLRGAPDLRMPNRVEEVHS